MVRIFSLCVLLCFTFLIDVANADTRSDVTSVIEIQPWRGWAVDEQDRVFTFLEEKASELSVWENRAWRKIPLPENWLLKHAPYLKIDGQSRLWIFDQNVNLPVAILSSDLKTWEVLPDYPAALIKYREDLEGFAEELQWIRPILGPRGQIAFRTPIPELHYWDGDSWKIWSFKTINPDVRPGFFTNPFFNDDGTLCVNVLKPTAQTWKFGKDRTWTLSQKVEGPKKLEEAYPRHSKKKISLPDDFQQKELSNPQVVEDNLGALWILGSGHFYKYYEGQSIPVFDNTAVHPFQKNARIWKVRTDRFGDTWFHLEPVTPLKYILLLAHPPIQLELSITANKWGLVTLDTLPEENIEWRDKSLDANWQRLPFGERRLGYFPKGEHILEFRPCTKRLDVIRVLTKQLSIKISSAEQMEYFIQTLQNGSDAQREDAMRGLERQPKQAIPALKKAMEHSSSWWLQAALQECERNLRSLP